MPNKSISPSAPVRYIRWKGNNFGDNINDVLFQSVFGLKNSIGNSDPISDGINLLGIGTIFSSYLRVSDPAALWVIGSGAGYAPSKPKLPLNNLIFFVRGPLTCQYLDLPSHLAIADSAYLLADHFNSAARSNPSSSSHRYGIIPHHWSVETELPKWQHVSKQAFTIDPRLDWKTFIQRVNACEIILTECLHGAIAADILRKPFIVFATTPAFHAFKWLDWAWSMELPLSIHHFNFDDPGELIRTGVPILSKAETLNRVLEQLESKKLEIQRHIERIATAPAS
jgi:succinoglycan biosynthesis protein ExoV